MTTNTRPAGPSISAVALDLFRKVSTATLTTQMFKRGFRNVYVRRATRLTIPATGNLVGPAFTMRYIPSGLGAVAPMLLQVSPDLDRAARVQGADWWTTTRRVIMPLMRPALVACYTILFISFFKEYATAIFLFAPGSEVIGTALLQLWIQGEAGMVAALAAIQVAVIAICVAAARAIFGVRLHG